MLNKIYKKKHNFGLGSKVCGLYEEEKLAIVTVPKQSMLLNERFEGLIAYKHTRKFLLANFEPK